MQEGYAILDGKNVLVYVTKKLSYDSAKGICDNWSKIMNKSLTLVHARASFSVEEPNKR